MDGEKSKTIPTHKVVNYMGLIPLLIASIQEQQERIEMLETKIAAQQQSKILGSENNSTGLETDFAMESNIPNPFSKETSIAYTLPKQVGNANLVVYDLGGKQIKSIILSERGSARVILTSDDLAAGMYIYSIIADGKLVDSKRMIVTEK